MNMTALQDSRTALGRNRKGELLAHAVRTLNARGVSQASLGQIAEDAGISRAALYYYVADLQDLVFQCYRETCKKLSEQLAHVIEKGGDEGEIVRRFIFESLNGDGREFASLSEIGYLNEDQRQTIVGLYDGLLAQLAGVIAKGVSAGRLRTCDPWIAAHTIVSLIFWIPIAAGWFPAAVAQRNRSTSAEAVSDLALNGLLAPDVLISRVRSVDFSPLFPSSKGLFDKEYLTLARREALMCAASRLFARKGVDATSLDEIAAAVGATKRAIIHYFGDKQTLIEHAYQRAYAIYILIPKSVAESDLSPSEQLASAFIALTEALLREDMAPLVPRAGVEGLRESVRCQFEASALEMNAAYVDIIARARAADQMREFDEGGLYLVLPGAFAWLTRGIFADPGDHRRIAREIADLLLYGLARDASST